MDERLTTPKAECHYAYLFVPSTKFDSDGIYSINLVFDPQNAEHKDFLATLKELHAKTEGSNIPWKEEKDIETGQPTGRFIVKFKSKFSVGVFDALNQPLNYDKNIVGSGSLVRVSFKHQPYSQNGGGLSLFLNAVQVIDLNRYEGGTAEDYGFEKDETGYNEFRDLPETTETKNAGDDGSEDLPF